MKKLKHITTVLVALLLCVSNVAADDALDEVSGYYIGPALIRLANPLPKYSVAGIGGIEVELTESDILYSELGRAESVDVVKFYVSTSLMLLGTQILIDNTDITWIDVSRRISKTLTDLQLQPYINISDASAKKMLDQLGADYLIFGKMKYDSTSGKWVITFKRDGDQKNKEEKIELNQEMTFRLVKKIMDLVPPQPIPPKKPDEQIFQVNNDDKKPEQYFDPIILPTKSRYQFSFIPEGLRPATIVRQLFENTFVSVHEPKKNRTNPIVASTLAVFDVEKLEINAYITYKGNVNGIQSDEKYFYAYGSDGAVQYNINTLKTVNHFSPRVNVKKFSLTKLGNIVLETAKGTMYFNSDGNKLDKLPAGDELLSAKEKNGNVIISDGFVKIIGDDNQTKQFALYMDDASGIIDNQRGYNGTRLIERHLKLEKRNFEPSDRKNRI